jgi:hypothetical protein
MAVNAMEKIFAMALAIAKIFSCQFKLSVEMPVPQGVMLRKIVRAILANAPSICSVPWTQHVRVFPTTVLVMPLINVMAVVDVSTNLRQVKRCVAYPKACVT